MSLRALLALLFCTFAFFGGASAFEGPSIAAEEACDFDCCGETEGHRNSACDRDAAPNKLACDCQMPGCAAPTRSQTQSGATQSPPATAQAPRLKARRADTPAVAASLFYAPFLTATKPDANAQVLARAAADPALATPAPALRVTQCRWRV